MLEQEIKIINKLGLHARASAKLVSTAGRFASQIEVEFGPHTADAKKRRRRTRRHGRNNKLDQ